MLHSVTLLYGKTVKIMYNWWQGEANIQRPFSETIPGLSGYVATRGTQLPEMDEAVGKKKNLKIRYPPFILPCDHGRSYLIPNAMVWPQITARLV